MMTDRTKWCFWKLSSINPRSIGGSLTYTHDSLECGRWTAALADSNDSVILSLTKEPDQSDSGLFYTHRRNFEQDCDALIAAEGIVLFQSAADSQEIGLG